MPLHHQLDCRFLAVLFRHGRQPSVGFSQTIAGGLSIAAFAFRCPANSTSRFLSSWTSVWGFRIRYCVSYLAACENPPVAILAIFKARPMSDCSSCTWLPCLAIVADMLKTYKKLVVASINEIQLLPLSCMVLLHPLWCIQPDSSTPRDPYAETRAQKTQNVQHHHAWFLRLWGWIRSLTIDVSHTGQLSLGHVALYVQQLNIISLVKDHLRQYCFTYIQSNAAAFFCFLLFQGPFFNVSPGLYFEWLHWQVCGAQTGVGIVGMSQQVAFWMKRPTFSPILIHLYLGEVFIEPTCAGLGKKSKMITKRSGKSCVIHS